MDEARVEMKACPREPTEAMTQAAHDLDEDLLVAPIHDQYAILKAEGPALIWRAMFDAAPHPPISDDVKERAHIVAWLREQSEIGADKGLSKEKGTTARAAFGGGSLALSRAADEIERGAHSTTAEAACESCAKPILRGQFIHCYEDCEVHVDCDKPFAASDDPEAAVLLGEPLLRHRLALTARDGIEAATVERERRLARGLQAFPPDAIKVLDALGDGERVLPASYVAADTGVPEARVKEVHRALRTLGLADYGNLTREDDGLVCGAGYWCSSRGYDLRTAIRALTPEGDRDE